MKRRRAPFAVALLAASLGAAARAQPPDLVLLDGKVVTVDAESSLREALAIRDGKILALGSTAEIRRLAGPATRVVDLGGRTVIPGLIDSHLHAVRAALSFSTEVNWIGARSLDEAMARIGAAARRRPPGAWLIVAGGWNELQFAERRRPTQAELEAAAPEQSRLRAARLRLGRHDRRRIREARDPQRRRPAGRRHARARRRAAHGRDQRRAGRDHRAVRSAAEADVRASRSRARASSSAS